MAPQLKTSPRRKIYPVPVEKIFDNPRYLTLGSASVGCFWRLCEHFWKTGCRPLPKDADQLFTIARAHRPTWRLNKDEIISIFNEVKPSLESYYHLREAKGTSLSFSADKSNAKRRLKALQQSAPVQDMAAMAIPRSDPTIIPQVRADPQRVKPRLTDHVRR
jgi:hypothetical protein